MEWFAITWNTIIMYVVVFIVLRVMGKREIGKLSVLDLVISVMIAEIAVIAIEDPKNHIMQGIYPIVILVLIQLLTAFLSMKSRKIRLAFDGYPSVIIAQGKINRDELRKQRYNLDDLLLQLREQGITSIEDVDFAILETSGKLSIVPKQSQQQQDQQQVQDRQQDQQGDQQQEQSQSKQPQDQQSNQSEANTSSTSSNQQISVAASHEQKHASIIPKGFRYEMLPIPLIMDGKVQDSNLEKLQKTRFWLKNIIQEKGVTQFKDVLLCTIDHRGRIYVDCGNRKKRH